MRAIEDVCRAASVTPSMPPEDISQPAAVAELSRIPPSSRPVADALMADLAIAPRDKLEDIFTALASFIVTVAAIAVLRTLVETVVYARPEFVLCTIAVHYPLFYLNLSLTILLSIHLVSGLSLVWLLRTGSFAAMAFLAPPLIDVLVYGHGGRSISYLPIESSVIREFVGAVFLREYQERISIGQFATVHIGAALIGFRAGRRTQQLRIGLFCWFLTLMIVFLYAVSVPATVELCGALNDFVRRALGLTGLPPSYQSHGVGILVYDDSIASSVHLMLFWLIGCALFLICRCDTGVKVIGRGTRFRAVHYMMMTLLGVLIGSKYTTKADDLLGVPTNWLALIVLLTGVAAAFLSAAWLNDIHDLIVDRVQIAEHYCTGEKPLATGSVTFPIAAGLTLASGVYALVAALLLGPHIWMGIATTIAISALYSVPPLRLRRHLVPSVLLIGAANMFTVQLGYSLVRGNQVDPLPLRFVIGITLGMTMVSTFKDIKDRIRDRVDSIKTLMTVLPESVGRVVTATLVLIGSYIVAITVLGPTRSSMIGLFPGFLACALIVSRRDSENRMFLISYISLIGVALIYLIQ